MVKRAAKKGNAGQKDWLHKMQVGQRAFRHGQVDVAIRAFGEATRLAPKRPEGWVNLGSALLQAGDLPGAEQSLRRAQRLDKRQFTAPMLLGDALRLMGRLPEARLAYELAVSLERNPATLNKLGCLLRSQREAQQAMALFQEALAIQPDYGLASVNRATLLLETGRFEEAATTLGELQRRALPGPEAREVSAALAALEEHERLAGAIGEMQDTGSMHALAKSLTTLPRNLSAADEAVLKLTRRYAHSAARMSGVDSRPLATLPQNWPLLEGLFMIPLIETAADFLAVSRQLDGLARAGGAISIEQRESLNVSAAVVALREHPDMFDEPALAEANLRYVHGLCCRGVPGFLPGHFKYTQNWSTANPLLRRVEPTLASATVQHFFADIYPGLPAGIPGAAVTLAALLDMHCFADGNARVAVTLLNRQLEWSGEMPVLFPRDLGLKGELGAAMRRIRANPDNLEPLTNVLLKAQQFALHLHEELSALSVGVAK